MQTRLHGASEMGSGRKLFPANYGQQKLGMPWTQKTWHLSNLLPGGTSDSPTNEQQYYFSLIYIYTLKGTPTVSTT